MIYPIPNYKIDTKFKEKVNYGIHEGLDLNVKSTSGNQDCGTPLLAVGDGEIVHTSILNKNYGNLLVLKCATDHGIYYVRYAHCLDIVKTSGFVKEGDVIAHMGDTGNSTACHLHFDVLKKVPLSWRVYTQASFDEYFQDPDVFLTYAIIGHMEITDQTKIPQILDDNGNQMEVQAIRSRLNDQKRLIESLTQQLAQVDTAAKQKIEMFKAALANILA